jgi:hypothetical protein
MFNPLIFLAAEANAVIVLRMMKLMRGGRSARLEAKFDDQGKGKSGFRSYHKSSGWCFGG